MPADVGEDAPFFHLVNVRCGNSKARSIDPEFPYFCT